jgi:hypothetical protein
MDKITTLFEQLPLADVGRVLRRTVIAGIAVGVVVLAVALLVDHPFVGLGACIGLSLGLLNIRLVARSVARVNEKQVARPRRALASATLVRLAATTAVVIGLAFASVQLGLGTAGGIALFYFLLLISLLRTLLQRNATGVPL